MARTPRKRRKRDSCAWALEIDPADPRLTTAEQREGLDYARAFAREGRRRLAMARAQDVGERLPDPLTVAELAAANFASPVTVNRRIKQARVALFGDVGPRQIQKTLNRARLLRLRQEANDAYEQAGRDQDALPPELRTYLRLCDCGEPFPPEARSNRKYHDDNCKMRQLRRGASTEATGTAQGRPARPR